MHKGLPATGILMHYGLGFKGISEITAIQYDVDDWRKKKGQKSKKTIQTNIMHKDWT